MVSACLRLFLVRLLRLDGAPRKPRRTAGPLQSLHAPAEAASQTGFELGGRHWDCCNRRDPLAAAEHTVS